jgi:crotonobetainyl-CoA:carnitine CoA-transferase CaiB-like acyl-CoA transferase
MTPGGPLRGYRVLDLADEMAALCGKMFADLGADVVKVEPLGGCPTRSIPPFLDDRAGPEDSCYFLTTAAGKRSVTLDLDQAQGRDLLCRLAERADFLIESFPLGYLDGLRLCYEALAARNPRLIYTSVTPFGDRGPGAAWQAADIVGWAAGGMMAMMGAPGSPPLQVSVPQACFHAGSEAAVASMLAHLERERSGLGQRVVVNMQAACVWATNSETAFPALEGRSLARSGIVPAGLGRGSLYRCADGYVQLMIGGGMFLPTTLGLLDWLAEYRPRSPPSTSRRGRRIATARPIPNSSPSSTPARPPSATCSRGSPGRRSPVDPANRVG